MNGRLMITDLESEDPVDRLARAHVATLHVRLAYLTTVGTFTSCMDLLLATGALTAGDFAAACVPTIAASGP